MLDLREAALGFRSCSPVLAEFPEPEQVARAPPVVVLCVSLVAARRRTGAAVALETARRVGRRRRAPG